MMKKLLAMILCLALLLAGCNLAAPDTGESQSPTDPSTEATDPPTQPQETEPPVTEPPAPETVSGTVLADRTAVILTTVDRGAAVALAGDFDEAHYVVKTELGYGLIEKRLVRPEGGEVYAEWDGYAYSGAKLYNNYHLLPGGALDLTTNTQIKVLDAYGDNCLVQVGEVIGYMDLSTISTTRITYKPSGGADGGDISLSHQSSATVTLLSNFVTQEGETTGNATVLVDGAEIILGWYDRGDTLGIIAEDGFLEAKEGFHSVYLDGFCGYVRQNLVAQAGAEPYTEWDGYARANAPFYTNYYLSGEPARKLSTNTEIHVLMDLGNCCLVSVGEDTGYMDVSQISTTRITYSGGGGGGEWTETIK